MKSVGARDAGSRRAVQREAGGTSHLGPPNLRCPRNGKQTGLCNKQRLRFHLKPLAALKQVAGKVMKVALSARIPANKVTCRKTGCKAHALSGKAVRAFDLLVFYEKFIPVDG